MANDWKERLGTVYSTNPDFQYQTEAGGNSETLAPEKQDLRVQLDKKQRNGKKATLITGFVGTDED
jgi:translation initiation factor 1